jgi:hypothetical protein
MATADLATPDASNEEEILRLKGEIASLTERQQEHWTRHREELKQAHESLLRLKAQHTACETELGQKKLRAMLRLASLELDNADLADVRIREAPSTAYTEADQDAFTAIYASCTARIVVAHARRLRNKYAHKVFWPFYMNPEIRLDHAGTELLYDDCMRVFSEIQPMTARHWILWLKSYHKLEGAWIEYSGHGVNGRYDAPFKPSVADLEEYAT